jgi:hypothetical protein
MAVSTDQLVLAQLLLTGKTAHGQAILRDCQDDSSKMASRKRAGYSK